MNILLTGGAGFIGRHLIHFLNQTRPGDKLFTLGRSPSTPLKGVRHTQQDLLDREGVKTQLAKLQPDWIFHLAGASRVTGNFDFPDYFESNFLTTVGLIEAVKPLTKPVSIFLASSVHVYGNHEGTVTEDTETHPMNSYGFSKYLAEEALRKLTAESNNVSVVVGRLYSCFGPGQGKGFVVPDLCQRLVELPAKGGTLETGPLNGRRSFIDIRDAVQFFPKLLEARKNRFEIYNVASPHELRIEKLVQSLIRISGKSVAIKSRSASEANTFQGLSINHAKLMEITPQFQFRDMESSLIDVFEWTKRSSLIV